MAMGDAAAILAQGSASANSIKFIQSSSSKSFEKKFLKHYL
jgi:hypothetical protein